MSEVGSSEEPSERRPEPVEPRRGLNIQPVNWLLVIPLIGTLVPPFYNFRSPSIGGMPFFYWYQMLWIVISVTLTTIVLLKTRSER